MRYTEDAFQEEYIDEEWHAERRERYGRDSFAYEYALTKALVGRPIHSGKRPSTKQMAPPASPATPPPLPYDLP